MYNLLPPGKTVHHAAHSTTLLRNLFKSADRMAAASQLLYLCPKSASRQFLPWDLFASIERRISGKATIYWDLFCFHQVCKGGKITPKSYHSNLYSHFRSVKAPKEEVVKHGHFSRFWSSISI